MEERPRKHPGPQMYWKTIPHSKLKSSKTMSKSESKYSTVENSDGSKTLMIDRKVTDKAIYKPMSSYIFQVFVCVNNDHIFYLSMAEIDILNTIIIRIMWLF